MLPYMSVKKAIASGQDYFECQGKWYGYDVTIAYEKCFGNVAFYFEKMIDGQLFVASYLMEANDFMEFIDYKDYIGYMSKVMYYNLDLKEE